MLWHGNEEKERTGKSFGTSRLALLAMLLCCALIVGYIERSIPFDFAVPGVKLGLANVIVLFALYKLRPGDVLILVILKCFLTSMFTASFTALAYSLGGSLLSYTIMLVMIKTGIGIFSPVGVSVVGAICHNIGQIMVASFILGSFLVITYLPILLISGVITGILVGVVAKLLIRNAALNKLFIK